MVWTDERSPLYRTVEKYNSAHREELSGNAASDNAEKQEADNSRGSEPDCGCEFSAESRRKSESECRGEKGGRVSRPPRGTQQPGNILQRLTGDRDFLLIAALIILLLHEKADMKLILALAFIILT